jgi:hypothetical protein
VLNLGYKLVSLLSAVKAGRRRLERLGTRYMSRARPCSDSCLHVTNSCTALHTRGRWCAAATATGDRLQQDPERYVRLLCRTQFFHRAGVAAGPAWGATTSSLHTDKSSLLRVRVVWDVGSYLLCRLRLCTGCADAADAAVASH